MSPFREYMHPFLSWREEKKETICTITFEVC